MHGNPRLARSRGRAGGPVPDATSEGWLLAPVPPEEGEEQLGWLESLVEAHLVLTWVTESSLPPSFSTSPQSTSLGGGFRALPGGERGLLHSLALKRKGLLCFKFY